MPDDGPDIEATASRIVYENRWMRVREDAIRRRDGSAGIYGVVEKADFVVVVPVEADGSIHLVQQFRYPVGARFWEFPQGMRAPPGAAPPRSLPRMSWPRRPGWWRPTWSMPAISTRATAR